MVGKCLLSKIDEKFIRIEPSTSAQETNVRRKWMV